MSGAAAIARERMMNETQPLPLTRSESSEADLYGSEMILYEAFWEEDASTKRGPRVLV